LFPISFGVVYKIPQKRLIVNNFFSFF
jgi:hypothetical protein